eukprot:8230780-Pyramimonas_sp.AAC.1
MQLAPSRHLWPGVAPHRRQLRRVLRFPCDRGRSPRMRWRRNRAARACALRGAGNDVSGRPACSAPGPIG